MSLIEHKPLWQKCIEEFSGYEKCKEILKQPNIDMIMNAQALHKHMLEYRRQHGIFEVGDKVFRKDEDKRMMLIDDVTISNHDYRMTIIGFDYIDSDGFGWTRAFKVRHATDEEIAAGHRL